jgi:Sulfotransferase domain
VREGWEPLCDFLDVEVPDGPFPRLNEAREMRRRLLGVVSRSAVAPVLLALMGVAATVFLVRRVTRSRQR